MEEPPICARCGDEYFFEDGMDPSKYCHNCAHARCAESEDSIIDFALMIRRLVAQVQKYEPESEMCRQAVALLEKHGIKSSPLSAGSWHHGTRA